MALQLIPLTTASTEEQENELKKLIKSSSEYITAMRCQVERQKQSAEVK